MQFTEHQKAAYCFPLSLRLVVVFVTGVDGGIMVARGNLPPGCSSGKLLAA